MRENAVFITGQKDRVELQTLGCVQGHQGDDASISLVRSIGYLVGVRDKRYSLQKRAQRRIRLCRPRGQVGLWVECGSQVTFWRHVGLARKPEVVQLLFRHCQGCDAGDEFAGDRDQLSQVLQSRLVLGIGRVVQLRQISRPVQHAGQDGVSRHVPQRPLLRGRQGTWRRP